MPKGNGENDGGATSIPRWLELAVSAGLVASTITGLIWVGTIDERVSTIRETVGGMDNGSRLATVERGLADLVTQQNRVEHKVDKLLDRQYGLGGGDGGHARDAPSPP